MIYTIEGNPEHGYYEETDVRTSRHGLVVVDSDGEWIGYATEAKCSICEGPIPEDSLVPLCDSCNATARAHARLERAWREWQWDGRP